MGIDPQPPQDQGGGRTLLVMRHAKSDWSQHGLADHDRPLNARGHRAARLMATHLARQGLSADAILVSSATRAQETVNLLRRDWGREAEVLTQRGLYLASPHEIAEHISSLPDSWSSALLVGHNPGLSAFVSWLSGQDLDMPTAAVAVFRSNSPAWRPLTSGLWRLVDFWKPRELESQ